MHQPRQHSLPGLRPRPDCNAAAPTKRPAYLRWRHGLGRQCLLSERQRVSEQLLLGHTAVLPRHDVLCAVADLRQCLLLDRAGVRWPDQVLPVCASMWHHLLVSCMCRAVPASCFVGLKWLWALCYQPNPSKHPLQLL